MATKCMQVPGRDKLLVAAIDFGTTYSGYSFSLRHDYLSDPLKVHAHQWTTGSNAPVSLKTPSAILFTPEQEFHSFGLDAEDKYSELSEDGQHHEWYYFRRFKMMLYESEEGFNRDALLQDERRKTMPAMQVFSGAIRFLKDHLIRSCQERETLIEDEIHWVLTVPAIWTDPAKQFMREAAEMAGIEANNLTLSLEPEAASLFCQNIPMERIPGAEGKDAIGCFKPGSKYLVLDAGGGTVDITVHEVQTDGTLNELFKANGGPWGGTKIDEAFLDFLAEITGHDVMEAFYLGHQADYMDLLREFEIKKRNITPDMDQRITFRIPLSLHEEFRDLHSQEIRQSLLMKEELKDKLTFAGDKLRVEADTIKQLFTNTCDHIVSHLKEVFGQPSVDGTDTVLMVGGFSESPMLRHAVEVAFPNLRVIVPNEAGLAVLKGAVIFGHKPKAITVRVCKYTYGIETCLPFRVEKHPKEKRFVQNNQLLCKEIFSRHADIGHSFHDGESLEWQTYYPLTPDQKTITLNVYTCDRKEPEYVDDIGCMKLGQLIVDLQDQQYTTDRPVVVRMIFGGPELNVEAKEERTGNLTTAKFDFLG